MLRAMRDRLASVSHEISELLGRLEWHVEAASPDIRLHARTAAADVVRTQEWLNHRLHALPQDPSQRYAAMQEMLQVQFVALQKISTIVNDVLSLRTRAPGSFQPALPSPSRLPGPLALTTSRQHQQLRLQQAVDLPWDDQPAMQSILQPAASPVRLSDFAHAGDVPRSVTKARSARTSGRGSRASDDQEATGRRSNRKLAVWTAALVAAVVLVGGAGYAAYSTLVGSNSATASRSAGKKERVSFGDPSAREQALAHANVGSAPRVPSAPPMAAPPLDDQGRRAVPGMMVVQPSSPRPDPRAQPFVAVIATHRDKQALTKIYNDLRKQYPTVLGPKRADAQTVNLGESGVWHHLVLMPPGPREQAEANCAELRSAGHARCMVRPY